MSPADDTLVISLVGGQAYSIPVSSNANETGVMEATFEPLGGAACHAAGVSGMDVATRKPWLVTCSIDKTVRRCVVERPARAFGVERGLGCVTDRVAAQAPRNVHLYLSRSLPPSFSVWARCIPDACVLLLRWPQVRVWNYLDRSVELAKTFREEAYSVAIHPGGLMLLVSGHAFWRCLFLTFVLHRPRAHCAAAQVGASCLRESGGSFSTGLALLWQRRRRRQQQARLALSVRCWLPVLSVRITGVAPDNPRVLTSAADPANQRSKSLCLTCNQSGCATAGGL